MTDKEALILLNMVEGLGPKRIGDILLRLDKPSDIFTARKDNLECLLGEKLSLALIKKRDSREFIEELKLIEEHNIDILTILDKDYPYLLKEIYAPPQVLYIKGERSILDQKSFSIVGSRRASFYGMSSSEKFSFSLAYIGFVIVSGMAHGIDTYAHKGALKAKGKTVAVLGSGLLNIYPKENKDLAEQIQEQGCLISEFPLKTPPLRENFPRRNRVISGLSCGVLVIEAALRSGALITANFALEQGREVFCLPGNIDSPQSKGTHWLIKQGAKLVDCVEDILEELHEPVCELRKDAPASLSQEEKEVYDLLGSYQKDIDTILRTASLDKARIYQILLSLSFKKLIKELPGKVYVRT